MGIGVDGHLASRLDGLLEEAPGWVEALGARVDLDGGVVFGAGGEHSIAVESRLGTAPPDHDAAGAVSEDVDVRARHRPHHARRHRSALHPQLRVDAGHHDVEASQGVLVVVETSVFQNVELHAGEDAKGGELPVQLLDQRQLLLEALAREALGDGEPGRVVGHDDVVVAEAAGGRRHVGDAATSVGPVGVCVAIAA